MSSRSRDLKGAEAHCAVCKGSRYPFANAAAAAATLRHGGRFAAHGEPHA